VHRAPIRFPSKRTWRACVLRLGTSGAPVKVGGPAPSVYPVDYQCGEVFGGFPPALSFFGDVLPVLFGVELELDGAAIESEPGAADPEEDGAVSEPCAGAEL
jgi:hypothetical protein